MSRENDDTSLLDNILKVNLQEVGQQVQRAKATLCALRVFPLPGLVLLPGGILPLHIFESRYRRLLADCRATDRILGLANVEPSEVQPPPLRRMIGVGTIVHDELLDDGRSIILVQGLFRARICHELADSEPYRKICAVPVTDEIGQDDPTTTATRVEMLRHLVSRLGRLLAEHPAARQLLQVACKEQDTGVLADRLGAVLLRDPEERQRLLEELVPLRRIDMVSRNVAHLLRRLGGTPPQDSVN